MMPNPTLRTRARSVVALLAAVALPVPLFAADAALSAALGAIRSVGPEGSGHVDAVKAGKVVASQGASALPDILRAMNGANGAAANWLWSCVETILEREERSGGVVLVPMLKTFLLDPANDPRPRRLSFEWLRRVHPETAAGLVPGFLNDPAPDLRREAIDRLAAEAGASLQAGERDAAIRSFQRALAHARDAAQVEGIAKSLRELGQAVDLTRVLGFLTSWKVIGPFDSTGMKGFSEVFPPELGLDFGAEFDGKEGRVRWVDFVAKDDFGTIDLNVSCGKLKEVAGYATTVFESAASQTVEFRMASENAWKLWLNGKLLFARDEYHRGRELDQYRIPATLAPGSNRILVKVCQDKMVEDWTVEWQFQLRVTDGSGAPVFSAEKGKATP
jgi:hypothetical protein